MELKEKERTLIQDLQTQEQSEHQPDCKDKQNKCGKSKKYLL